MQMERTYLFGQLSKFKRRVEPSFLVFSKYDIIYKNKKKRVEKRRLVWIFT